MAAALKLQSSTARAKSPVHERLDAASRAIDGHFLKLGGGLGQAVDGLGKLVASLDKITETLDPRLVEATTAELQAAARDLLNLPERHALRSGTTHNLAAAAERLAVGIDDMRRTLAYLHVFAINIKITAGGIASAGAEFGDFAQEIGACIELGRTRLDAFEAGLGAVRGGFKSAFAQERALADQCAGLLPAVPDGLVANAEAMVGHHRRIGEVAGEVARLVRDIRTMTGSALAALQIGDITRQRIEHASEALDMLDEIEGLNPDQTARMTAFVHRLLDAQLCATADDFHREVERLSEALAAIASDARDILRLRDLVAGRADGDDKGVLRQIETHVGQALSLVGDMAQADRQAEMMGASVSSAAVELSAQITELRTIKTDVQYMALNTTLKCGRLGDAGKPLAVIAVELRLHAGHMDTSAQEAMTALDELTTQAGLITGADKSGAPDFAATVGQALSDVAARLRAAGDDIDADLALVAREGDAVVDGLGRASAQMKFRDEIGETLYDAADALSLSVGDDQIDVTDIAEPLRALLARVAKRYTMAQEREVFQRLAGDLGVPTQPAQASRVSEKAELDEVLF
jgi:hypothetical protein